MAELTLRNARTEIQRGIVRAISNAYKVRLPAAATPAALRLLPSLPNVHDSYRVVTSLGKAFRWARYNTSTDNGTSIIKPADVAADKPGRWVITSSAITSGYLKTVQAYNGAEEIGDVAEQMIGQRPAVLVVWTQGDHKLQSQNPAALWWYLCSFDIYVFATNLRDLAETEEGSEVSAEASADPGINQILGDLKSVLAGADYSLESVSHTDLLTEERIDVDQGSRTAIEKLGIKVHATLYNPDDDLTTIDVGSLYIQKQLAETPENLGAGIGPEDYVVSGGAIPLGESLTQTPDPVEAYVGSTLVSATPAAHTFTANSYTFRDLKADGTYRYTAQSPYAAAPSVASGELRIGITQTSSSGVVYDRITADSLIDYGPPDQVPPT